MANAQLKSLADDFVNDLKTQGLEIANEIKVETADLSAYALALADDLKGTLGRDNYTEALIDARDAFIGRATNNGIKEGDSLDNRLIGAATTGLSFLTRAATMIL